MEDGAFIVEFFAALADALLPSAQRPEVGVQMRSMRLRVLVLIVVDTASEGSDAPEVLHCLRHHVAIQSHYDPPCGKRVPVRWFGCHI